MKSKILLKSEGIKTMLLMLAFFMIQSCYSLKSAVIPPELNSFFVAEFDIRASNALPTLPQTFSDALRNKILNESRLVQSDIDPDISFSGEIMTYRISSVAPERGATSAFNRLEIAVNVKLENTKTEDQSWTKRFSFFENYDRNTNINDIQDELIDTIVAQLVEDIYNASFTSW
ncbi:MAG: hypothetical protein KJP00_13860 [Bacteroidia bacterium]|nr:hypothetical protein [Bacteroidia bacterium]